MGSSRGDASVTRKVILAAARDLFASHGVNGVSVRQIAAAAGINHALVHRYFGTKDEMVAEIVLGEARALGAMAETGTDTPASLASVGQAFSYLLGEGRTSLLLMLRAELDGVAPERLLAEAPMRPLRLLAGWIDQNRVRQDGAFAVDARVAAMVAGAAIFGLASMQPMLAAGVGLEAEPQDEVLRDCLQAVVALVAAAVGAEHPAPAAPPGAAGGEGAA